MKRMLFALLLAMLLGGSAVTNDIKREVPAGTTRVAVVNIGYVFQNYYKAPRFKQEIEETLHQPKIEAKKLVGNIALWENILRQETASDQEKAQLETKIRQAKRKLEDLELEVKKVLGKKQEESLLALWKDVQSGIQAYALQHQIDVVFGYGDPAEKELLDRIANVNRKMQMMDQGGTVPLFVTPRADISQAVTEFLNKRRHDP